MLDYLQFLQVSTHSRLKAAGGVSVHRPPSVGVSTHSRLKAAGPAVIANLSAIQRFNTQPPEGGWKAKKRLADSRLVSTHSRLKAAG